MMIKIIITVILAGYSVIGSSAQAGSIRFAPLPMENRETIVTQFRPLTAYLEQCLDVKIEYVYLDNYSDLIEKFRQKAVDLAYLGPLPYVELRAQYPQAEPLVQFKERSGQATYTCAIVSFPDAAFDLTTAEKRKIALTQPLSTCGYLSTSGLMRRSGSSLERNYYRYLGQHDAVALSVLQGEYDAGGLKTAIARNYVHLGLQIMAETPPLPGFALVANSDTLSSEMMSRLRQELIALDPAGKHKEMLEAWSDKLRYGTVMATDDDFRVVRELHDHTAIPTKGN
jgi:phosphonate transport system substrate-binding protein